MCRGCRQTPQRAECPGGSTMASKCRGCRLSWLIGMRGGHCPSPWTCAGVSRSLDWPAPYDRRYDWPAPYDRRHLRSPRAAWRILRNRADGAVQLIAPAHHTFAHAFDVEHAFGKALAHELLRKEFIVFVEVRHLARVDKVNGVELVFRLRCDDLKEGLGVGSCGIA